MEAPWVQRFRSIIRKQKDTVVDAKITDDYHLLLKRRDESEIDAGIIRTKRPGTIAYVAYDTSNVYEPDIYVTKDGIIWKGAASESRWHLGTSDGPRACCWTGDRFLAEIYIDSDIHSALLQSRDGGTWSFHPDKETFSLETSGYMHGMDATETGLVVIVGQNFGGHRVANIAISYDFGETWTYHDEDLDPFGGLTLDDVCVKNDFEWVVRCLDDVYYTYDGGAHWSEVTYPDDFNLVNGVIKYFNGYWWFAAQGQGSAEWDTPIIKSEDLLNWIPVITPFSGTYPPFLAYNGGSHDGDSGSIHVMEYDKNTNTVMVNGSSRTTYSYVMMSDDGGEHWIEIGYQRDDSDFRIAYGWDGIFKWPTNWHFYGTGGVVYGFGWWFLASSAYGLSLGEDYPPVLRISLDGQITEKVHFPRQQEMYGYVLIGGGDRT